MNRKMRAKLANQHARRARERRAAPRCEDCGTELRLVPALIVDVCAKVDRRKLH